MEANETREAQVEETTSGAEQTPDVEALKYEDLVKSLFETAKSLGQLVWIDKNSDTSNTIKIVRMLTTGEKQFFTIALSEVEEITMAK